MKKILCLVVMSALVISLAGCQVKEKPVDAVKTPPVSEVGENSEGVPQGITVNDIKFERVLLESLDEELQQTLNDARMEKGHKLIKDESSDYYYLAVFSGQKPTAGYSVEIIRVEDNKGIANVTVKEVSPDKDSMNAEVITYPMDIVKLTGITDNVKLNFISEVSEEPSNPIGQEQTDPNAPVSNESTSSSTLIETEIITATYEGQIDNNSIEINVNGEVKALRLRDISAEQLKELNPQTGDSLKIEIFKNENGQYTVYTFLTNDDTQSNIPGKKVVQTVVAEYVGQIDNNSIEVKIEDGPVAFRLTDLSKEQLAKLTLNEGDLVKLEVFEGDNNQQIVQLIEKSE